MGTLTAPRGFALTPRSSPIRGGPSCIALWLGAGSALGDGLKNKQARLILLDGCRGPWSVVVRIPVKGWASALVAYPRRG